MKGLHQIKITKIIITIYIYQSESYFKLYYFIKEYDIYNNIHEHNNNHNNNNMYPMRCTSCVNSERCTFYRKKQKEMTDDTKYIT